MFKFPYHSGQELDGQLPQHAGGMAVAAQTRSELAVIAFQLGCFQIFNVIMYSVRFHFSYNAIKITLLCVQVFQHSAREMDGQLQRQVIYDMEVVKCRSVRSLSLCKMSREKCVISSVTTL